MKLLIPSEKKQAKDSSILTAPALNSYYLPLKELGVAMVPTVQPGERVLKYQCIAKGIPPFENTLHAPVSGTVEKLMENGADSYILIQNDFRDEAVQVKGANPFELPADELIRRIQQAGIAGSGGALFPTHIKLSAAQQKVQWLIINGTECEPLLTADYAVMRHHMQQLCLGIQLMQRILCPTATVITIEQQHRELKKHIEITAASYDVNLTVQLVPDFYPQGGELQLVNLVAGKQIRKGNLPLSEGALVQNIGTVWQVYRALLEQKPFTERVVTISARGGLQSNYLVKIGTSAIDMLTAIGQEYLKEEMILVGGGPMMGRLLRDELPVIGKGTGGLLLLNPHKAKTNNCIGCGYCVEVCPQQLMPLEFAKGYFSQNKTHSLQYHVQDCILCGACDYVCPSEVPLMQSILYSKSH